MAAEVARHSDLETYDCHTNDLVGGMPRDVMTRGSRGDGLGGINQAGRLRNGMSSVYQRGIQAARDVGMAHGMDSHVLVCQGSWLVRQRNVGGAPAT